MKLDFWVTLFRHKGLYLPNRYVGVVQPLF